MYFAWRFLTCLFAWKLYVNRLRASCVINRGVWMAIGLLDCFGVSVSCVASFGMRRGERRLFLSDIFQIGRASCSSCKFPPAMI